MNVNNAKNNIFYNSINNNKNLNVLNVVKRNNRILFKNAKIW